MPISTVNLMRLVANVRAGMDLDVALETIPADQRDKIRKVISIAVLGADGQLESIQPIDYTLPQPQP